MNASIADEINRWIVRASLDGADEVSILGGACNRLVAAGVPLMRAALASDMLDPSFDSLGVRWNQGQGRRSRDVPPFHRMRRPTRRGSPALSMCS